MLDELYDDLDDTLTDEEHIAVPVDGRWDAELANRLIRAVASRRRKAADAEQIALAEIDKTRTWLDEQRARLSTSDLEAALAGMHRARLEADPRLKTISLPAGDLVSRTATKWEFDDGAFLTWAAQHRPDLVRTKHEADKVAAKKALTAVADGPAYDAETGEVAVGVTATVSTSYSVRVNTGVSDF